MVVNANVSANINVANEPPIIPPFVQPQEVPKKESENTNKSATNADKTELLENPALLEERSKAFLDKMEFWKMMLEAKDWAAMLGWQPSEKLSLSQNIEQLQQIYTVLKNAILQNTTGEELNMQLAQLENYLSKALNGIISIKTDVLISFLGKYGQADIIAMVKASLYKMVTGETLLPKDAYRFLNTDKAFQNTGNSFADKGTQSNAKNIGNSPQTSFGTMYNKAGGSQNVSPSLQVMQYKQAIGMDNAVKLDHEQGLFFKKGSKENAIITKLFSAYDLEKTNRFIKHISRDGLPFSNIATQMACDELLGISIGILALKTQVFSQNSNISKNMSSVLKSVIDQVITQFLYFEKTSRTENEANSFGFGKKKNNQVILKVYHHILGVFQETKNPKEALSKGVLFAMQLFSSKSEEDNKGFFYGAEPKSVITLKEGLATIRNNWNQFVASVELKNNTYCQLDASFINMSPWGATAQQTHSSTKLPEFLKHPSASIWILMLTIIFTALAIVIFSLPAGAFAGCVGVVILSVIMIIKLKHN